jgi:hypothetical protein
MIQEKRSGAKLKEELPGPGWIQMKTNRKRLEP